MKETYYSNKLKSPKWKDFRTKVISEKGSMCENCGEFTSNPQIHHKGYIKGREPWDYSFNEVSVLCSECHTAIHYKEKEFKAVYDKIEDDSIDDLLSSLKFILGDLDRIVCERFYSFMRNKFYEYSAEEENKTAKLQSDNDIEEKKKEVYNLILKATSHHLDPVLDGLDYLYKLNNESIKKVLEELHQIIKERKFNNETV